MDQRRIYRTRRRWRTLTVVLVALGAVLAAALAYEIVGLPAVEALAPTRDGFVRDPSPTLLLEVRGLDRLSRLRVHLDGKNVTAKAERQGDRLAISAGRLDDGVHRLRVRADSSNVLRRSLDERWQFTVDTQAPELSLDPDVADGSIATKPSVLSGTTEPGATVLAEAGAVTARATGDATGQFELSLDVPEGPVEIGLTATDRAGNTVQDYLSAYVDATPPTLSVERVATVVRKATFTLDVSADDVGRPPKLAAKLDGAAVKLRGSAAAARLPFEKLPQGKHVVAVTASDRGGNQVTEKRTFVVDSTERFGNAVLWPGARGKDVRDLQQVLAGQGFFETDVNGRYGTATVDAVKDFQERYGLVADGKVGQRTLIALSGRIVVDLSDLRLYLYRGDELVKSYSVAAGQAKYPTPTGSYHVVSMVMNPTWYPPDSEWAKDAEPIPPGIANPLGTRWIGTSAPGIGVHGTPDDGSIGSYASHGCIRMHIWEVEQLYGYVALGMPVLIRT